MDPSPPPSKTGGRRTHGFSKYGTVRSLRESLHPPFANYRSSGELRRIGYAVPHYVCVCVKESQRLSAGAGAGRGVLYIIIIIRRERERERRIVQLGSISERSDLQVRVLQYAKAK